MNKHFKTYLQWKINSEKKEKLYLILITVFFTLCLFLLLHHAQKADVEMQKVYVQQGQIYTRELPDNAINAKLIQ